MSKNDLVLDLQNSLKEVKGVEAPEGLVVDFLNEYVDEEFASDEDVVKSDSVLEDLSEYVLDRTEVLD